MTNQSALELIEYTLAGPVNDNHAKIVKTIKCHIEQGRRVTPKQAQLLEAIYRESSGGGQYQRKERISR